MKNRIPRPALFKASNPVTREEKLFETYADAQTWALSHQDWILKKRETVYWTYPLERILPADCWVRVVR